MLLFGFLSVCSPGNTSKVFRMVSHWSLDRMAGNELHAQTSRDRDSVCMQRVATTWLSLPIFPDNTPHTHTISPTQGSQDTAHRKWHVLRLEQLFHSSLGGKLISQHSSPEHSSPVNRARRQQKPNRGALLYCKDMAVCLEASFRGTQLSDQSWKP